MALVLRPLLALSWLGLQVAGCGDPLMERGLLEGPRVLGARVEAVAEPSRAWVAPGEDASMAFLVAEPRKLAEVSWAFSVCEAVPTARDAPICAGPPFAEVESQGLGTEPPGFTFTLPEPDALLGADQLLASGAICFGSEVRAPRDGTDLLGYRCSAGGEPHLVAMNIGVERDGEVNHNPELATTGLSFDSEPWLSAELDADLFHGCDQATVELPRVSAGSVEHVITLTVAEGERERVEQLSSKAQSRETYQLSHVVSAGELERPFSVIDDQTPEPELSVLWDAPTEVPPEGLIVRFFFVARDLRGGADFALSAVCVEPD